MIKPRLRKRGDIWHMVIEMPRDPVTGRRRQRDITTECARKKDAEDFLENYLKERITGQKTTAPAKMTVNNLLDKWLEYQKSRVRESTWQSYQWTLKRIKSALGNLLLEELAPLSIEDFLLDLRSSKLSATSIRYHYNVLSEALTRAVRWRLIAVNPALAVDPPKKAHFEAKVLNNAELATLIQAAQGKFLYLPIVLAATCGLRRGEVCGIRWQDVDLDHSTIYVRHTLDWIDGKLDLHAVKTARSERSVKLAQVTVEAFKKEKVRQAADKLKNGELYQDRDYCWAWDDGRPYAPDYLYKKFCLLLKEAKLPTVRFHDLRHSHATSLLASGVPVKIISERLGHTSVSFTQDIYAHVLPNMQQQAADMVDRLFPVNKKGS